MMLCEPGIVDKTRWLVPIGNHTYEVDEFYGDNEGLVVAEVELKRENEPFERAPFLDQEVTGDRKYYNSSLRVHPFKEWKCGRTVVIHTIRTPQIPIPVINIGIHASPTPRSAPERISMEM